MKTLISILTLSILFSSIYAQVAPTNFSFTTKPSQQTEYSINGWSGTYSTSTTYNMFFGYTGDGVTSNDGILSQFKIGTSFYSPITLPNGECYDNVIVNRVANTSESDLDKQTLFFVRSSKSGNNIYFSPSYTDIQEAVNTRIMDRGGDNIFNNLNGKTVNNVERIDLLISSGVYSPDNAKAGFLINERGGNDNFKAAAITSLDANGHVSSLGSLISVLVSNWGSTGRDIVTTVVQRNSQDQDMRPSQDLSIQTIYGTYISFANLGIASNTTIYGIAIFPDDVTSAMNLVDLTNVPLNTTDGNGDGGLDLMGGGGFFSADDNQVVDLQVTLQTNNSNPNNGDNVNITVKADNNGPFNDNNISLSIVLPDGYTYNGLETGYAGNVTKTGNTLTWTFNNLIYQGIELLVIKLTANTTDPSSFSANITGALTDVIPANNNDNLSLQYTEPLPIELISFSGERNNEDVSLYWSTASEINNDYFEIQRSENSIDFVTIGEVKGAGNSNKKLNYFYTISNDDSKLSYYRLKQVDFDGKFSFSNAIVIAANSTEKLTVYPNPSSGNLTISNIEAFQVITIINYSGQILQQFVSASDKIDVDFSKWGTGLYYVVFQNDNITKTKKVIIL